MTIGEIIANRRRELNLTLEDIGKAVGVGKSTVKKWESGYIANMKRDKIALLANVLQISPSVLIGGDIQPVDEHSTPDYHDVKVALFGGDVEVTDEMWEEVRQFAEFVKAKHLKEKK